MRSAWIPVVVAIATAGACSKDEKSGFKPVDQKTSLLTGSGSGSGKPGLKQTPLAKQIKAPFDTKAPPPDAVKTKSGLAYKMVNAVPDGKTPGKNDLIKVHYTGWKATGETVYSTTDKGGQPMQMSLQAIPPGFSEAILLMKVGEKAVLWIPPEIGYRDNAKPPNPEPMVYEVELVEVIPAPPVPPDLGKPPAQAKKSPLGNPYIVLKPGTGTDKPRTFDNVVFNLTAWDSDGNQVESTENGPGGQKRPQTQPPFRQAKGLEDMLISLTAGERARFWVPADQLTFREKPKASGPVTVDIEINEIQKAPASPPPVPKDVAAPPTDAKKTARGTFYKLLKKGKAGGKAPVETDTVSVHYTGWTTDGRMFDSSVIRAKPQEFGLKGVIQGWTDGLQQMKVGETVRFWVPESLAYQGRPGKPAGMLVFDVELLEIKAPPPPPPPAPKAPADVAAPPTDAKKTDSGLAYKVVKAAKTPGAKPGPTDTVKVHYSGWTTDGKGFDSSIPRNSPAQFPLNQVIKGWTEGLQLMSVGDTYRFWIPVELAYNNAPGKPAGMLVFDVELLEVQSAQ
jgi:FKBP-type peptidyl-prolyl cis-trans isomerase